MAFAISAASLPALRFFFAKYLSDVPTELKNHKGAVPTVGGCAVALGFFVSLTVIRFSTDFISGMLNSLRGIFYGGFVIFALGIIDDINKPKGLGPYVKLFFQIIATALLIKYGISIKFLPEPYNYIITALWVICLTNAMNIIDIMDGLAASQAILAAAAFLLISLPSEHIYVNFAAAAMLGATLGFWPYNHIARLKSFLGDSGSTLTGFILAALSMGAEYSKINPLAVFVPLLMLALPLFDVALVFTTRILKGKSPLKGGPEHFAIRLQKLGFKKRTVLAWALVIAVVFDLLSFYIAKMPRVKL
jgi:UDP-GlcNAc:undecaprenyl-phosphate GlcNAc-1-phosphate transferase